MTNRVLDFSATGNEALIVLANSIRQFCENRLPPRRLRKLRESGDNFDLAVWREMVDAGWTTISLPEEFGGLGLGCEAVACVNYELGRVAAAEPVLESATTGATLLAAATNTSKLLADLIEHGAVIVQPNISDSAQIFNHCVGESIADGIRLNGFLSQIPNCPAADYIIVPTVLDSSSCFVVIEAGTTGTQIEPIKLADHTYDGSLKLHDVFCAHSAVLKIDNLEKAIANTRMMSTFGASAYMLGLSESLLEQTLEYIRQREQFGQPIGAFQSLQHRTVDWYLQLRLCAAALKEAFEFDNTQADASVLIERLVTRASKTARLAAREAIKCMAPSVTLWNTI